MKWMKLKNTTQISTYFVLHKNVGGLSFSYFSFFPKALCPGLLEEFLMLILENGGLNIMVNQSDGALPHFRVTILIKTFP